MKIDRRSKDWQLGFDSALSGWSNIPPAGAEKEYWLAGWREGRIKGREREQRLGRVVTAEPAALRC